MDRRTLIGAGVVAAAAAGFAGRAVAQITAEGAETIPIWPKDPPGGEKVAAVEIILDRTVAGGPRDLAVAHTRKPTLTVFRPATPNGGAILIFPGGGYVRAVMDKEGFDVGRWFAARGFTCFAASYRMPGDGWAAGPNAPLQDAQRALRLIRGKAAAMGFKPDRIAVMGFSAGGHLAASLITRFDEKTYEPVDTIDQLSARPDAGCLMYAVVSLKPELTHGGSRSELVGGTPSAADIARYSAEAHVTANTPPTFILHAADDPAVQVGNATTMFAALQTAKVKTEMHIFQEGGHGFGIRGATGKPVAAWPELVAAWLGKLWV